MYTDPQIHTISEDEYGDGNLGVKGDDFSHFNIFSSLLMYTSSEIGMALFFHSHCCNAICKGLGLEPFDLALKEKEEINSNSASVTSTSQTVKLLFCVAFVIIYEFR